MISSIVKHISAYTALRIVRSAYFPESGIAIMLPTLLYKTIFILAHSIMIRYVRVRLPRAEIMLIILIRTGSVTYNTMRINRTVSVSVKRTIIPVKRKSAYVTSIMMNANAAGCFIPACAPPCVRMVEAIVGSHRGKHAFPIGKNDIAHRRQTENKGENKRCYFICFFSYVSSHFEL